MDAGHVWRRYKGHARFMNENSSASEQQRVFFKIGAFAYMRHEGYTEEKIAEKLEFGSVEAMRIQLRSWGLPGWMVATQNETSPYRRHARRGRAR